MLEQPEATYSEADWQRHIMRFIQVLFPKYVVIKEHPRIKIEQNKTKIPDILLGDVNGYVDIVEVKKPFGKGMLTAKKSALYRDNYIPLRELSGAVMQCEKYIYHMVSGAKKFADSFNKQYASDLPTDYSFQIVNPRAMIIIGRSDNFDHMQKEDFELIKRKYKNIIDIITYDDLLYRLSRSIDILECRPTKL